jgi:hypothetical protein
MLLDRRHQARRIHELAVYLVVIFSLVILSAAKDLMAGNGDEILRCAQMTGV